MSDDGLDDDFSLDPMFKNSNTVDDTIATNRRVTRQMKNSNEDPLLHEQCLLLILRRAFDLKIAKTQHRIPPVQQDVLSQLICVKLKHMEMILRPNRMM